MLILQTPKTLNIIYLMHVPQISYDLSEAVEILSRTPAVLRTLLAGLPDHWTKQNEGPETWSPYDVVGHLIHGEKTDWLPRMEIIFNHSTARPFDPFDRFAQFKDSQGKTLNQLLDEFEALRKQSLNTLQSKNITVDDLKRKGVHQILGEVTLQNLLATWVAHDLNHIGQIVRTMAKQYEKEVGPWKQFLGILN
jgi:hypothetical protein